MIDANFSAPNLALHFGLADPEVTLHDVVNNKVSPMDAVYEYDKNLHLIPGSMLNEKLNPFKLREKVHKLKQYYDFILLDSSPNLNNEMLATMLASDELLVVTSPDYPTLSCTMHAVKIARERKTPITGLVLNKVRGKSYELKLKDIEDATTVPVLAVLDDEDEVLEALAHTKPVVTHRPRSGVSIGIKKLAAALVNKEYKDPRVWSTLKRMFSRDAAKPDVNLDLLREGKMY